MTIKVDIKDVDTRLDNYLTDKLEISRNKISK